MSAVIAPVIVGVVNGKPVRMFKTPLNDGRPDLPWHATDDLAAALGCDRGFRQHFQRSFQKDHPGIIRSVATTEGVVTIAPHFAAQGLVGAMVEVGVAPETAEIEYARSATEAAQLIFGSLADPDAFNAIIAAYHRWSDNASSKPGASS